ncbi:MAG: MFS transporter [Burkholderiales bacterium]|nr:MFS transporter [Burkholderiales bacterium]
MGKPFRGWVVVGASFTALAVIFGVAYAFASFFASFEREFAAPRADVSLVFAIAGFVWFGLGAVTGTLADRLGPRPIAVAGMLLLALGLFAASRAQTLAQVYVTYGLGCGLGVGFVYVPAIGAVQPWFRKRLGLAAGIASAGIGMGTLVTPYVAVELIDALGWRGAFAALGAFVLVVGVAAAGLLENDPARRGLHPDGAAGEPGRAPPKAGLTLRETLRTRVFWIFYGSLALCTIGQAMPFAHLLPYALDHGHAKEFGAILIGLVGVGSVLGRFVLGGFGDRVGRREMLTGVYAAMAALFVVWALSESAWVLAAFALLYGVSYGGFVGTCPPLATDYFGPKAISGIVGVLYTGAGIGYLVGPLAAGAAYDLRQSYTLPILAAVVLLAAAAALSRALPPSGTRVQAAARAA